MGERIVHFAVLETGPTGSRTRALPLFAHSIGNPLLPAGQAPAARPPAEFDR
ncbi:hypothetical protein ACFJGW_00085 [Burkholderiaceae bacterium UC74_6]